MSPTYAWREIEGRCSLALIERGLRDVLAETGTTGRPTTVLAHLLVGAFCESAMVIARSPDPRAALAETTRELDGLLAGILRG